MAVTWPADDRRRSCSNCDPEIHFQPEELQSEDVCLDLVLLVRGLYMLYVYDEMER